MDNVIITINKNGFAVANTDTLGNYKENKQKKIVFQFLDKFIDGTGYMEYEINNTKYYIELEKNITNKQYSIDIKSSLLASSKIRLDLKIYANELIEDTPIFVSKIVEFYVSDTINADEEAPQGYPTWMQQANQKLTQIDNLDINAEQVGNITQFTITKKDGTTKEVDIQTSSNWGEISGDIENQTDLINKFTNIENKIPNEASISNKLADKDFVMNSIITNTAYFRGTFNSLEELEAYSGEKSNNDYAFVKETDEQGNTTFDRYKYVESDNEWVFEYSLSSASFTENQWDAINSGINSEKVSQYNAYATEKANVSDIPTKTSDLTNDSGFLTQHQSLSAYRTSANQDIIDNNKQAKLVSGSNIKTINNESILGSGNITIQGGGSSYSAGEGIDITNNTISITGATDSELGGVKTKSLTQAEYDALQTKDTNTFYSITDASGDLPPATTTTLGGVIVGDNLTVDSNGVLSANSGGYTLPTASANTLGGIKVGNNLSIDNNGVLSATGGGSNYHTYSTTEQQIGYWIDNKPLYEITMIAQTTSAEWLNVDISNLNAETIFLDGSTFLKSNTGNIKGLNVYESSTNLIRTEITTSLLSIQTKGQYYKGTVYAILHYTKTSDNAN